VVRETGGLKDSVINFDKYNTPEGNGFSFANFNAHELLFTIKRGLTCYEETPLWEKIVYNAMHSDNSWNRSAQAYVELYAKIAGDTVMVEPVTEEQVAEAEEEILQAVKGEAAEENATAEDVVVKTEAEDSKAAEKTEEVSQPEQVKTPEPVAESAVKKTVKRKTTAKKKTAEKTEEKKETVKKAPPKKTAAKKTTTKKTTAKKSAAVTEETVAEAVVEETPKKRGRKPGTKNKKKEDQ
jgi:starch synthase